MYEVMMTKDDFLQVESVKTQKAAEELADTWATNNPDKQIFVSFYRASDGQRGYINRDGAAITGKSWTNL